MTAPGEECLVPAGSVVVLGNQGNAGFRLARMLRGRGWPVELAFLERTGDSRSLPEQIDPAIASAGDPDWVHRFTQARFQPRHLLQLRTWLRSKRRPGADWAVDGMRGVIASRFAHATAFVAFGREVDFCTGQGRPVVMYPVGSPVTEEPFLFNDPTALRRREALRAVDCLITPSMQVYWLARTLGMRRIVAGSYPVDPDEIRALADHRFREAFEARCDNAELIFFSPSRKNLDPAAADYKGPEKILEAFDAFRAGARRRVRLVCNLHGRHRAEFEAMVRSRPYADEVVLYEQMTRPELFGALASRRVVVFDQFPGGAQTVLAGTAREAVASGAVTVCGIDTASRYFRQTYGDDCPVIEAHETDEIVEAMRGVDSMEFAEFDALRERTARWTLGVTRRHIDLLARELARLATPERLAGVDG